MPNFERIVEGIKEILRTLVTCFLCRSSCVVGLRRRSQDRASTNVAQTTQTTSTPTAEPEN